MKRVVFELETKLAPNGVLVFRNNRVESTDVHLLVPELKEAQKTIAKQNKEIADLKEKVAILIGQVKELRGED